MTLAKLNAKLKRLQKRIDKIGVNLKSIDTGLVAYEAIANVRK